MRALHKSDIDLITCIADIAVTHASNDLMIFNSFDEAKEYQEKHCVSGQVIELPLLH